MMCFKVVNTTTREELFVKADNIYKVLLYLIKYKTPDWFYGVNIIQVRADKTRPRHGNFLAEAIRSYYTNLYNTEDDKVILRAEFENIRRRLAQGRI